VLGTGRLNFGSVELLAGFHVVPVAMGLFGVAEILANAESPAREVFRARINSLWMTAQEVKDSLWPVGRGTLIGFFLGLIPGLIATVPTIVSYTLEKKLSRHPGRFGSGVIEGVAGPETANNAYANAALIPLFTLGIPSSPTIAILMGALLMNGLVPGPSLFTQHADFAWTVIASLYVGNLILLIINLPLVPFWVSIIRVPYPTLAALILMFCVLGAYSLNNSVFDVAVMLGCGVAGYVFKKFDYPLVPLIITLVLGPLMEKGLRQSLAMSGGDLSIFAERPIAVAVLAISAALLAIGAYSRTVGQFKGAGGGDV
jgi:putative tricarboxylic transport membrane protein